MKKILLLTIAVFSFNLAQAQRTHFGLKAGLNTSTLKVKNQDVYDYKVGLHVGGLAHIHVTRQFAVQPELLYSNQGGKLENSEEKRHVNYIAVPVMGQYMFGDGFRLQAGPQVGFLVGAKRQDKDDNRFNIKENYEAVDFSLAAGLSFVSRTGFGADFRWLFGLTNINDVPPRNPIKNNLGQIGVFYLFNYNNARHTH
ncbi:porin family protein [Adhaeribacter rhizoryzae]|nr:porin family protein [Adhaeribacter rhizoryzae]